MRDVRKQLLAVAAGLGAGPVTVGLANATSPVVALALLAGTAAAAAMVIYPFFGFLLTVLAVPLERIGRLTNDSSAYTFSIMRALGLLNLAAIVVHCCLTRRKLVVNLPLVLYGIYIVIALLSITQSPDSNGSIRQAGAMIGNLLFFFVIPNLVQSRIQVRLALACWLVVTTGIGIYTIYQWHRGAAVTDSRFHSTGERSTDERFSVILEDHAEFDLSERIPRALGPTSHPAVYAINTIMTIPFFAYFFRRAAGWKQRSLIAGAAAVAFYNVLLTNTRAAFVTLLLVVLLTAAFKVLRPSTKLVVALVMLGLVMIPFLPDALYNRIFDISNYSTAKSATMSARLLYWSAAIDVFAEHPLLGIGLGNQTEIPKRITQIRMPPNSTAHNEYLNSLIEVGIFGWLALMGFFVVLFLRCISGEKTFRQLGDSDTALLLTASKVMFIAVLFYAIQVDCFHFPLKGWWLAMGLAVVLHGIGQRLQARQSEDTVSP